MNIVMRRTCVRSLFFLLAAVLLGSASSPTRAGAGGPTRLGTNLNGVVDWSTERPFLNLFKQARAWITQCGWDDGGCSGWDTGEEDRLDLDENGWVKSLPDPVEPGYSIVTTVLDVPEGFPSGRYLLRYEGKGTFRYGLGTRRIDGESTSGREVIDIDVSRGLILIQIVATDPDRTGDYLRNLRLVSESDEPLVDSEIFTPEFLARTEPFTVLRFMDWMGTNGSELSSWGQRSLPARATYTGPDGVPIEIMIALANRLGKAAWFNIPHRADDDYIRHFAELTRDQLGAAQSVYVEYSNEVWNGQFAQHVWVRDQAVALWPGDTSSDFTKTINWYGKRSAEVCDIWKRVFGAQSDRVICVLGAQAANDWTAAEALLCPLWAEGAPCQNHGIDAIAIAPYFGGYLGDPESQAELEDWASSSDGGQSLLLDELRFGGQLSNGPDGGALGLARDRIERYATLAAQTGLELISYEGGQHLVGYQGVENSGPITELFVGLNRDLRMGDLYQDYLQGWSDISGGGLMMHFADITTPGKWGSWGALEDVLQTESPKYLALLSYLDTTATSYYQLSVLKKGDGDGSVSGGGTFAAGTTVTPTATAGTGSTLAGWTPGTCGSPFPLTVDTTCTASFAVNNYVLTVNKAGTGTGSVSGAGTYAYNTRVTPTATAATGSTFSGWSGACSGSAACIVTMTSDQNVAATFTATRTYTLSVNRNGNGSVTSAPAGVACGNDCSEAYAAGTTVALTAAPAKGRKFSGWGGDCKGTGSCIVTMSKARTVSATFR